MNMYVLNMQFKLKKRVLKQRPFDAMGFQRIASSGLLAQGGD